MKTPVVTVMRTQGARRRHELSIRILKTAIIEADEIINHRKAMIDAQKLIARARGRLINWPM